MNYEFNLLDHVGVVVKSGIAAVVYENNPSCPMGRGVKMSVYSCIENIYIIKDKICVFLIFDMHVRYKKW